MRDFLTYIGVALIALLSAIFAAPYVVDFNAFRPNIAAELSRATGARARLDGRIALHFLPTPRFSAEDIDISGDFGRIHAKNAVFTLAAPGLLRGKLQFTKAVLDDADVVLDADGRRAPALAGEMQFDDFALRRADVTILRGGVAAVRIEGLDLAARIPGPQGPFDGRGTFEWQGRRVAFTLASDVLAKNVLPLKASLAWPEDIGRIEFDGRVDFGKSAFEGDAKAEGKAAPGPWTAQASMRLSLDGAQARDFSARLGDGPLADGVSGDLGYQTGAGKITLALDSPHLSQDWAEFFAASLTQAAKGGAPFELRLGADALTWRGASWSGARLSWKTGAPAELQATGPGDARIEIFAAPEGGGWRGKVRLNAKDFVAFTAALRPDAAAGVHASPQAVEAAGEFAASPEQWALTGGEFLFGRNRFFGALWYRPAAAGRPPQLTANLSSGALDLDSAPDFAFGGFAGLDLDLSLHARTLKSARAGVLSDEGGRIDARLLRRGDAVRLERLDMSHIGGADLFAAASWRGNFSGLRGEARLKAGDLGPLAKALARMWPDVVTRSLAARAKILSPADLAGKAEDGGFVVNGTLGATQIAMTFPPASGAGAVTVDLSAPEAGTLLDQLGAPVIWTQDLGPARLFARAEPDPARDGMRKLAASADIAGLHGEFRGGLAENFSFQGDANLAGDAGAILALYSIAPAGPGPLPAPLRLSAHAEWRDSALALSHLAGDWEGVRVAGDVEADSTGLKGTLQCGRFSGAALVALVLGPPPPAKAGALWSSLSFAPVVIDPPPAQLSVMTDDLEPFGGKARFDLALRPGALSVARAEAAVLGGMARGGFDLRRDGRQVSLSGEAEADDLALSDPAFSARLDGKLKFAGGGASASALAASLSGEGALLLRDLLIRQAAPDAADAAFKASEALDASFDAKAVAKSLDAAFAREPLRRHEAGFAARLADGQLVLAPSDDGGKGIEASFDLRDASLSLAFSATAQNLPAGWTAPAPGGSVIWSGPWRSPARRVDAAAFVDAVATRALDREQARIEKQKKQDRERLRALSAEPTSH
jgi:AsmA family